MYAIVATGGKQYRVKEGETLRVEKLFAEAGETVELDKVLLVGEGDNIKVGAPYLEGAKVTAKVNTAVNRWVTANHLLKLKSPASAPDFG